MQAYTSGIWGYNSKGNGRDSRGGFERNIQSQDQLKIDQDQLESSNRKGSCNN